MPKFTQHPTRKTPIKAKKNYHHGDLRQAVRDAAVSLIAGRKEVSFTLREIAAMISVSHAAVYRHFANKRAILAVIAEDGLEKLIVALTANTETLKGDLPALVKAQFKAYLTFAISYPGHFRAMFHEELSDRSDLPELALLSKTAGDLLLDTAAKILQNIPNRKESAESMALSFWAMAHGLAALILNRQFPTARADDPLLLEQRINEVTAILLRGLYH